MRSIPACTGEPVRTLCRGVRTGVYPRVYGGTYTKGVRINHAILDEVYPRVYGGTARRTGES